jgi:hypothetical protein
VTRGSRSGSSIGAGGTLALCRSRYGQASGESRDHPIHGTNECRRVEQRGAHGPAMHRLVGDPYRAEMLLGVGVHDRIDIDEAQPVPEEFDIVLPAGQEQPAGPRTIGPGIGGKPVRCIALRLQRYRNHADLVADARAEQFLHAGKVLGRQRADRVALGEEEVDENLPFMTSS